MGNKTTSRDLVMKDSMVVFDNSQKVEVEARLLHLGRHQVAFEIHSPGIILRLSEVLADFRIVVQNRPIYSGRAVVASIVNAGPAVICQASLEDAWLQLDLFKLALDPAQLSTGFDDLIRTWQKVYRILPEYKTVIADIQAFLSDLRLWLEQVEMGIRSSPAADRIKLESEVAHGLRGRVTAALSNMFERFEAVSNKIEEDLQPAHRAFGQRQLHPLLLCAPFIYRTYTKPLGYAGDYEMMNMIVRNGLEGNSLYAKLANGYLLDQVGPQAVRNRISFLNGKIINETSRIARLGRMANIFSIACGPAREVEDFLAEQPLADQAQFCLLDFNEETLRYTGDRTDEVRRQYHRKTSVTLVKKSVYHLLKEGSRPSAGDQKYDLIYCSGLYDYLTDRVVKAVNTYLYEQLQPGGLLVVGNFAPNTPVKHFIEHFLEWFLNYRDGRQLAALAPEQVSERDCKIIAEPTGTNIFLEIRKPL